MSLEILKLDNTCTGCGACVSICPKNALALQMDHEGFYRPAWDESICINCHLCEKACHVLSRPTMNENKQRDCFMAKAKDKNLVSKSSSGGVFSILADKFISEGGVVYGARYDFEQERLEQSSTERCSLDELRKSKYIESFCGSIFKDVARNLKDGKKVLYVGTPCQVEGLAKYLQIGKINSDNLLLVRFVCHGVPSNQFFTEYKHYEEKKHGAEMLSFDFRPKTNGWRSSDWKMNFKNGKEDKGPYYYYYYYYYFQSSNILRKSCYSCNRVLDEVTDLTIGDFWGIHKYAPENKDNEGISLIIAHSDKGKEVLKMLDGFEYVVEIPESALQYIEREANNRGNNEDKRSAFMGKVQKHGYMKAAIQDAWKPIFFNRIKGKLRKFLKRK